MFKKIFIDLCNQKGESPSFVCGKIGISPAAFSQWTDATVPRQSTIKNAAEYFDVSIDYLLGKEEKPLPLGRIIEREEDELWAKITRLDETDRIKIEAYADGLLAAEKYQEPTHLVKIAARAGGGIREVALTESQIEALKNLPEVPNLDGKKDKK